MQKSIFWMSQSGGVSRRQEIIFLNTIIRNYSEDALVVMSTHLISDIERVLDEAVFINRGQYCFSSQCG